MSKSKQIRVTEETKEFLRVIKFRTKLTAPMVIETALKMWKAKVTNDGAWDMLDDRTADKAKEYQEKKVIKKNI